MMSTPTAISPHAFLLVVTALVFLSLPGSARPRLGSEGDAARPRLLVLTDISSLTPGLREPDDGQSMIRLMLYANEIDLEGLIASSNLVHGQTVRSELIREVV